MASSYQATGSFQDGNLYPNDISVTMFEAVILPGYLPGMSPKRRGTKLRGVVGTLAWIGWHLESWLRDLTPDIMMGVSKLWRRLKWAPSLDELPPMCGARDPSNNHPVAIIRGEPGYFIWTECMEPEEWNEAHHISPEQVKAMLMGSVFGWPKGQENAANAETHRR